VLSLNSTRHALAMPSTPPRLAPLSPTPSSPHRPRPSNACVVMVLNLTRAIDSALILTAMSRTELTPLMHVRS
jgi:hypothetical protein